MSKIIRVLFILGLWISISEGSKILVFMFQLAKSHHIVYHPVIKELAARGHEVDFYTHHPVADPPPTLKHQLFSLKHFTNVMEIIENLPNAREAFPQFRIAHAVRQIRITDYDDGFLISSVQELLASNKTYDMVIGEFHLIQEELTILVHRFKALGVALLSMPDHYWVSETAGLPMNPSYELSIVSSSTDQMSFFERVHNFLDIYLSKLVDYYYVVGPIQRYVDQKYIYEGWKSRPSVMKLVSDMALILEAGHHSFGYSLPKAPHVKEIMGTHIAEKPGPLPKDLLDFMDSAKEGVIYFSLGSIASTKMLKLYNAYEPLLKVFTKLPQKVLWKWTSWSDEEPPQVPNIKFVKWAPQQSVLAHDKIKLFITHGGLGGLTEAVYNGIPLIGIPVFGDQIKNVKLLVRLGLGLEIGLDNVTEASLSWTLEHLLNDPKYKQEALRRSDMFRDRPMKPVDEAVYWIEYVLRHGKVLQPAAAQMPFYQLYLLDVIGFLAISTLIAFVLTVCLLKVVGRKIVGLWKGKSDCTLKTREPKKMKIS